MIEQQRLDGRLHQVPEVVAAAEVGQFVGQDHLQLPRRQLGQHGGRQDHQRPQPAQQRGHRDLDGNHQLHRVPQSESLQ